MSDLRLDRLAAYIAERVRREVGRAMSQPQLAHSSIEDGSVDAYDAEGTQTMQVGRQYDGTNVAASLSGPVPPTPSAPAVAGVPGGLNVTLDGTFVDGSVAPMDFLRFDVHASGTPGGATVGTPPVASIPSPRGGSVFLALDEGTYYAAVVARSQSGKASEASGEASGAAAAIETELSDGDPPTVAPDVTAEPFAVGAVQASWAAVENPDPIVGYEVAASMTSPVATDGTDTRLTIQSTKARLADLDGTDLPIGQPVYLIVRAVDGDGPGPWSDEVSAVPRSSDEFITAQFIAALEIEAQQIIAGSFEGDLGVLGRLNVGGYVVIDGATSTITVYADLDHTQPVIQLAPNNSVFRGRVETDDINSLGAVILKGMGSQLAAGADLTLMAGVADPQIAPTLSTGLDATSWPTVPSGFKHRGIGWDDVDGVWLRLLVSTASNILGLCRVEQINTDGESIGYVTLANVPDIEEIDFNSICRIGNRYFSALEGRYYNSEPRWQVASWTVATGAFDTLSASYEDGIAGRACVGPTGNGNVTFWSIPDFQGGVYGGYYTEHDPDDLEGVGFGQLAYAYDGDPNLMGFTGAAGAGEGDGVLMTASAVRPLKETEYGLELSPATIVFESNVAQGGVAWHPTLGFHSVVAGSNLSRYSDYVPAVEGEKAWVSYADTDDVGAQTTIDSPMRSIAIPAHTFLTVSLPSAPTGVERSDVYMTLDADPPDDHTSLLGRPEPLDGRTMFVDPTVAGDGAPPTANTFPAETSAVIRSILGDLAIYGDGTLEVGDPTADNHAANKGYVDSAPAERIVQLSSNQGLPAGFNTLDQWADAPQNTDAGDLFSLSGGTFTCQKAGRYDLRASLRWTGGSTEPRYAYFYVNGSRVWNHGVYTDGEVNQEMSYPVTLAVGDEVEVLCYHSAGSGVSMTGGIGSSTGTLAQFTYKGPA